MHKKRKHSEISDVIRDMFEKALLGQGKEFVKLFDNCPDIFMDAPESNVIVANLLDFAAIKDSPNRRQSIEALWHILLNDTHGRVKFDYFKPWMGKIVEFPGKDEELIGLVEEVKNGRTFAICLPWKLQRLFWIKD